jgi:predicted Zn-dependent protease
VRVPLRREWARTAAVFKPNGVGTNLVLAAARAGGQPSPSCHVCSDGAWLCGLRRSRRGVVQTARRRPHLTGPHQARLDAAAHPLLRQVASKGVAVRVLGTAKIGAYGWPGGQIFVTRGLIDRVTDEELSAAVAHELGHLLADGHLVGESVSLLAGGQESTGSEDSEVTADAVGIDLLEAARLPQQAMVTLLQKVRAQHSDTPTTTCALDRRISAAALRVRSAPNR